MSKYNVGEKVPVVFDTQPNIAGLTDMQMHGVDVVNDADLTAVGSVLSTGAAGTPIMATELVSDAGTYKHEVVGLPAGTYLIWMSSVTNGATSNKVLVNVTASVAGDPFYGQAQA